MEEKLQTPAGGKKATGFFSDAFYRAFRALFRPLTWTLRKIGITPNAITLMSMVFGIAAGIQVGRDHLWSGLIFGYFMAFSDIVDGQLAKEYNLITRFGGVLDSVVDRYNEFFIFAGLGARFYFLGEPLWLFVCAFTFANSIATSYVKARAEADGFDCNVGKLQRPERLAIVGIAVAFNGLLLKPLLAFLAVGTVVTVLHRVRHVYKQTVAETV
jgi:CDP-diacylglycerol---glycerol-3-phosphate 3-phosphatidyltransferase